MAPKAWKVFGLAGLCATGIYFLLLGAGKDLGYSAVGVSSVIAVIWGAKRRPRSERTGWYSVALGNLLFVLGDSVYDLYQFVIHRSTPFPSIADALYLAGYPFLIFGVVRLTRGHSRWSEARESYADAAIITCGALALSWHFLMASYTHDTSSSSFAKFIALLYPVMDLGVLYIVARALLLCRNKSLPLRLLGGSMGFMLAADFAYDLLSLHNVYATGNPVDSGWLISYTLVGAAALCPEAVDHSPERDERSGQAPWRLPVVALSGFVPPGILFVAALLGAGTDVTALALMAIVVFALVASRMRWMFQRIASQNRALEAEMKTRLSLEVELRYQALHDTLTGLGNRVLFYDRLEHALDASGRSGEALAVCFCDLDRFKAVNDSLGHLVGDQTLVAVGKLLEEAVRPGDTVARFGGDEFAVLLEGVGTVETAVATAERIVSNLRRPLFIDGHSVVISASVGVAVALLGSTTERLLQEADSAMYEAKMAGRNQLRGFRGDGQNTCGGPDRRTLRTPCRRPLRGATRGWRRAARVTAVPTWHSPPRRHRADS